VVLHDAQFVTEHAFA